MNANLINDPLEIMWLSLSILALPITRKQDVLSCNDSNELFLRNISFLVRSIQTYQIFWIDEFEPEIKYFLDLINLLQGLDCLLLTTKNRVSEELENLANKSILEVGLSNYSINSYVDFSNFVEVYDSQF